MSERNGPRANETSRSQHFGTRSAAALACLCTLAACSGTESDAQATTEDDFKGCPADIPAFAPGLLARGQKLRLELLAAQPAEPERYANDWDVELSTLEGAPAADASIVRGQTFMPVHGHDGRVEPEITALPAPGHAHVARLTFTMRGPWEVRFWLRDALAQDDYAVFKVCVSQ